MLAAHKTGSELFLQGDMNAMFLMQPNDQGESKGGWIAGPTKTGNF